MMLQLSITYTIQYYVHEPDMPFMTQSNNNNPGFIMHVEGSVPEEVEAGPVNKVIEVKMIKKIKKQHESPEDSVKDKCDVECETDDLALWPESQRLTNQQRDSIILKLANTNNLNTVGLKMCTLPESTICVHYYSKSV